MRELIAELPALSVAIPAISIALPIFSVLLLSAIFHWIFEPDNTSEETPDQDTADTQNSAINDAKTSAAGQLSTHRQATDYSRRAYPDAEADLAKTSTNGSRLKIRNRHPNTDLPEADSAAAADTARRALTTMRRNTLTTEHEAETASESSSRAPASTGSTIPSAAAQVNSNATHQTAERNSDQQSNNTETDNATHNPFYKKPEKPGATDWLSERTENNPNTNQDGELRVTLSTARPPSSTANSASATTADTKPALNTGQGVSSKNTSIDNQIDASRASLANSLYLDLDNAKRNRSTKTTQDSASNTSNNHQTENTLSGTATKYSPVQNYAKTSKATNRKSNQSPGTSVSDNKLNSSSATNAPTGATGTTGSTSTAGRTNIGKGNSGMASHFHDSSAQGHQGDLARSQKANSSDGTHSDSAKSNATQVTQSNSAHDSSLNKRADQNSNPTTEGQNSSRATSDNQQTENSSPGYATTAKAADNKSNTLTNTGLSNNKLNSSPANNGATGTTNTTGTTITDGSTNALSSNSTPVNRSNGSSAKSHQGDLARSLKATSSSTGNIQLASTPTNNSTATANTNNATSQPAIPAPLTTENNKAGTPKTALNRAIDSSDNAHPGIAKSNATQVDQSNSNHGNSSFNKHADQNNNTTAKAENSSQATLLNQQTENTSAKSAHKHSTIQNYATTSKVPDNTKRHNSPSTDTITGPTTDTDPAIKNEGVDGARSNTATTNHLNAPSTKQHQGDLARSQKTDRSSVDKTPLAGTPTNGSSTTATPAISNTNSPSTTATTAATGHNKTDAPISGQHSAINSSETTNAGAVNSNLTPADQSNPNHSDSSFNKQAGQHHSANTEAEKSPDKTRATLDTTTQAPSVNAGTGRDLQPGQSDTRKQPTLQSSLHSDKKTSQAGTGPTTTASLPPQQNQSTNKHTNSSARGSSRSPERPKYQTAAKTKYIPSSVEAQIQLKAPSTGNNSNSNSNNSNPATQSATASNIVDTKLLAEKDQLIAELEAKLKAFQQQAGNSEDSNQHLPQGTNSTKAGSSNGINGKPDSTASSSTQMALNNTDSTNPSSATAAPGSTHTADIPVLAQAQNSPHANSPADLLAVVKTNDTNSQEIHFKGRYEKATEKLALNEDKIQKLQSTINRLQASGLVELQNEPTVPHGRKTLLSKVRVMAPTG